MANNISLASVWVPMLDETYQEASLTGVLDGANELVTAGARAHEMIIPKMTLDGLGDYSRSTGYPLGDVNITEETVKPNYDRGKMFTVDTMDNIETAGIAFGRLAGEFIRTKVVPEIDTWRIAQYAGAAGITSKTGALADGKAVVAALREATNQFDEDEIASGERYLFITPTLMGMVEDLLTIQSKEVFTRFGTVIRVPGRRMATQCTLDPANGFTAGGSKVNFLLVHKPAVIQYTKHLDVKVIQPRDNQTADAWKFGYRVYGITALYENKLKGVYAHIAA